MRALIAASPGYCVELALASRQENDRQLRRAGAQLAAELEAALDLGPEIHVDDHKIGKAGCKTREGFLAAAVAGDAIALPAQPGEIVVADRDLVLDHGYELGG